MKFLIMVLCCLVSFTGVVSARGSKDLETMRNELVKGGYIWQDTVKPSVATNNSGLIPDGEYTSLVPEERHSGNRYVPLPGSNGTLCIGYRPVTVGDYKKYLKFLDEPVEKDVVFDDCPITAISYNDVQKYCEWLTLWDDVYGYRLPTEEEWMRAAGPMPRKYKKMKINAMESGMLLPSDAYDMTVSACGAVDMWGNVWEFTSSEGEKGMILKGGSYQTPKEYCQTEYGGETLGKDSFYEDVGFRLVRYVKTE